MFNSFMNIIGFFLSYLFSKPRLEKSDKKRPKNKKPHKKGFFIDHCPAWTYWNTAYSSTGRFAPGEPIPPG